MKLRYAALTHQGKVRDNNEDNFYVDGVWREDVNDPQFAFWGEKAGTYFIASVCDGMGGEELGEIASVIAISTLDELCGRKAVKKEAPRGVFGWAARLFKRRADEDDVAPDDDMEEPDGENAHYLLRNDPMRYVSLANGRVCRKIDETGKKMGTTFSAVEFTQEGAVAVNLGDSHIYLLNHGLLYEISIEHSPVANMIRNGMITKEEGRVHPMRHRITQYLGVPPERMQLEPAVSKPIPLKAGDVWLLCSDGLTDMLTDEEILGILCGEEDLNEKANILLEQALNAGGRDNTTVLLIEVEEGDTVREQEITAELQTCFQDEYLEPTVKEENSDR